MPIPLIANPKGKGMASQLLAEEMAFRKRLEVFKQKIIESEQARKDNPEKYWKDEVR